jgi:hypothetical protein
MISDEEWVRIKSYVNRTCNREMDASIFRGGRVDRGRNGDILIILRARELDLEPDPEDEPNVIGT